MPAMRMAGVKPALPEKQPVQWCVHGAAYRVRMEPEDRG